MKELQEKRLIGRIEEIYEKTKSKVKRKEGNSEDFWTTKGVRHGCPLSPLLFLFYLADVDEYLRKKQAGGVTLGNRRVYTLEYADDLAVLAQSKEEMKEVLRVLEKYLDRKRIILNPEKSTIMVFQRGGKSKKTK